MLLPPPQVLACSENAAEACGESTECETKAVRKAHGSLKDSLQVQKCENDPDFLNLRSGVISIHHNSCSLQVLLKKGGFHQLDTHIAGAF